MNLFPKFKKTKIVYTVGNLSKYKEKNGFNSLEITSHYESTTISLEEALNTFKPSFITDFEKDKKEPSVTNRNIILAAILGDISGSLYEGRGTNDDAIKFPLFRSLSKYTDDTVSIIATVDAILNKKEYADMYYKWANWNPCCG